MASQGDMIHNPVSGERVKFLRTARDTNGGIAVLAFIGRLIGYKPR